MKLGLEVKIILPRPDGTFYRACPKCEAELDLSAGEWVPDFPDRTIHGYRISQLFSQKVAPGEILREYRTTKFPDRFYNLKIGIPWADLERRLDVQTVLAQCGDAPLLESARGFCTMGVDTGRDIHVVILMGDGADAGKQHLVYLAVCHEFGELNSLLERFNVGRCVIDGLPETHATREFARAHRGRVYMNFFNEHQRGAAKWDDETQIVKINRTEALDASRAAVREKNLVLPRQSPIVEVFAKHMAADAKILNEDEETGAKKYRYIRTGADHFSLAFTYAWMAAAQSAGLREWLMSLGEHRPRFLRENPVFEPGFYGGDRSDPRWERNPVLKPGGFW